MDWEALIKELTQEDDFKSFVVWAAKNRATEGKNFNQHTFLKFLNYTRDDGVRCRKMDWDYQKIFEVYALDIVRIVQLTKTGKIDIETLTLNLVDIALKETAKALLIFME